MPRLQNSLLSYFKPVKKSADESCTETYPSILVDHETESDILNLSRRSGSRRQESSVESDEERQSHDPSPPAKKQKAMLSESDESTEPECSIRNSVHTLGRGLEDPEESDDNMHPAAKQLKLIDENFESCGSVKGRKRYRCKICFGEPGVVNLYTYRGKMHGFSKPEGRIKRVNEMLEHLGSDLHSACKKASLTKKLTPEEKSTIVPLLSQISKATQALGLSVARLIPIVYNDAKRGTISAWSYPSRLIAFDIGQKAELGATFKEYEPPSSMGYCNPRAHREFLTHIVQADMVELRTILRTALAVSLRVDGSVDKYQRDNKHVMAKVVLSSGEDRLVFLGFARPSERKTAGYVKAVREAVSRVIPWEELFPRVTSIATDGESLNTGEHNSLWATFREERAAAEVVGNPAPFLTIWCAAHRSNLAFEKLESEFTEVNRLIQDANSLGVFFHNSGSRTAELELFSKTHGFKTRRIPKYFEVRFAQFSENLLESILTSWEALVYFMVHSDDSSKASRQGFLKNLTDVNRLKLMCFLTDLLTVFSSLQKSLQSNSLTLFELRKLTDGFQEDLDRLLLEPIMGGWESSFNAEFIEDSLQYHGVQLWEKET